MNYTTFLPSIQIVKQTSLSSEKFARDGEQKDVNIVVKNSPFTLQANFHNSNDYYNFLAIRVQPTLVYDCEENRIVDFVKHTPLEYKSRISEGGTLLTLEIRIKVLSSQLEDMSFRIQLQAFDVATNTFIPKLSPFSAPIRVVSKPEQVLRKAQPKTVPKTPLSEKLTDSMATIVQKQEEQGDLIKRILEFQTNIVLPMLGKRQREPSFEDAFDDFLRAYKASISETPSKKVKVDLQKFSSEEVGILNELISQFKLELFQESEKVINSPRPSNFFNTFASEEIIDPSTPRLDKLGDYLRTFHCK